MVNISTNFGFGYFGTFAQVIDKIGPGVFAVIGVMIVFYFMLGAYEMIVSTGSKENVAHARARMTHAIIGFILLMFAYLVVEYIPVLLNLTGFSFF